MVLVEISKGDLPERSSGLPGVVPAQIALFFILQLTTTGKPLKCLRLVILLSIF